MTETFRFKRTSSRHHTEVLRLLIYNCWGSRRVLRVITHRMVLVVSCVSVISCVRVVLFPRKYEQRQWHVCVMQRTTNALLEHGCATRIQNQRMRCLIQKWLYVASSEIDRTLTHVRIEEKAALRISRHYMQQCMYEMRHNAAARAYRRRIYQAQTRAACRSLFIAGMLAFRSFVENR